MGLTYDPTDWAVRPCAEQQPDSPLAEAPKWRADRC
jgi:hypothetical protein